MYFFFYIIYYRVPCIAMFDCKKKKKIMNYMEYWSIFSVLYTYVFFKCTIVYRVKLYMPPLNRRCRPKTCLKKFFKLMISWKVTSLKVKMLENKYSIQKWFYYTFSGFVLRAVSGLKSFALKILLINIFKIVNFYFVTFCKKNDKSWNFFKNVLRAAPAI